MTRPERIIIVAMTRRRVIGRGNAIPWHLPEDLQLFRRITLGHTLILGRKTFESIGGPLEGRHNIVLSRTLAEASGAELCRNFSEAVARARSLGRKIFFAGGEAVYRAALPLADALRVSWVEEDVPGDTFFPAFDLRDWTVAEELDFPGFTHVLYRRRDRQGSPPLREPK